MFIAVAGLD